jgi:hypothetical protein
MKIVLIFVLILFKPLLSQCLEGEYHNLAKFAILKYALEVNYESPCFLERSLKDIEKYVINKTYKYKIEIIDSIKSIDIISIIDESNFQLHGLNQTIFAIDKSEKVGARYKILTETDLLSFINQEICPEIVESEKFEVIKFYNKLFEHYHNGFDTTLKFFDKENSKEFEQLGFSKYINEVVDKDLIPMRDYYNHYYLIKDRDGSNIDFYQIVYTFICKQLNVEHYLIIRKKA